MDLISLMTGPPICARYAADPTRREIRHSPSIQSEGQLFVFERLANSFVLLTVNLTTA